MNINLLPRKTYVERRFGYLLFVSLLLLIAGSTYLWKTYIDDRIELYHLQDQVNSENQKLQVLMENKNWNERISLEREKIEAYKVYKATAESLNAIELKWSSIIKGLLQSRPAPYQLIEISAIGYQISGTVALYDLQSAAVFIERLEAVPEINNVQVTLINQGEGNTTATPSNTYYAKFSANLE